MLEYFVPSLMVLSQSELLSDVGIKSIGKVSLDYAG
jgi:flagellar biosynthesis component FlhA